MVRRKRPPLIRPRPILKPDFTPRDDENVREAVAALDHAKKRRRGVRAAERKLVEECEHAQKNEDRVVRQNALFYLFQNVPEGGEQLVYRAIRKESHDGGFVHACLGVFKYARERGVRPSSATLSAMADVVCDRRNHAHTRSLALQMLGRYGGQGRKAALLRIVNARALAEDRVGAHSMLIEFGHVPSKRLILSYLRRYPDSVGYAQELWRHRGNFHWRSADEWQVREVMEHGHERFRTRLYDRRFGLKRRAAAVRWLIWLAADGLEFAPEDVKQAKRIARMCDKRERKDLNKMLREFERSKKAAALTSRGGKRKHERAAT